jgi:hypothetical protein
MSGTANDSAMHSRLLLIFVGVFAAVSAAKASAEETGVLTLDQDSFISYSDSDNPPLSSGSTIRFRFGAPMADGSVPVRVETGDLSIAPVQVSQGGAIEYSLVEPATGRAWKQGAAIQIELLATLRATLRGGAAVDPLTYELHFTTGSAQATNVAQTESVLVAGEPAVASHHVKLVGAATNRADAFPGPGEAVYAVLSGTFDSLPDLAGN